MPKHAADPEPVQRISSLADLVACLRDGLGWPIAPHAIADGLSFVWAVGVGGGRGPVFFKQARDLGKLAASQEERDFGENKRQAFSGFSLRPGRQCAGPDSFGVPPSHPVLFKTQHDAHGSHKLYGQN